MMGLRNQRVRKPVAAAAAAFTAPSPVEFLAAKKVEMGRMFVVAASHLFWFSSLQKSAKCFQLCLCGNVKQDLHEMMSVICL